jgi:hypothetical protein
VSPFAGRHPRGISAGATSREGLQTSRRVEPATRGARSATRRARANRPRTRVAFARAPRPTVCLVHASGTRRAKSRRVRNVARRSPVRQRTAETDATGIGWCRRVAGRKPHSRARVERSSGVPARRLTVAEVGKLRRGSEKRASRWQRGAWTGAWLSTARKSRRGRKGVDRQQRGGQVAVQTKSEAGRSKGRCGATVLARWKTPRVIAAAHLVHAGARRVISAAFREAHARASGVTTMGDATGVPEVRFARVTAGRQRPPRRLPKGRTCDPPKRIVLNVKQAISSIAQARKRLTHREPTRRGCSYEEREMAEVGPTHRASPCTRSRKASRRSDAGRGALRTLC